jgi:hypothetical protein
MTRRARVATALVAVIVVGGVLCVAAFVWFVSPFAGGMCGTEVLRELPSPSGRLKAGLLQVDCGATTGFNRHVQVLPAGKAPGNDSPLVVDDDHGKASLDVQLRWDGDERLVVGHDAQARVFHAEPSTQGVALVYEPRR